MSEHSISITKGEPRKGPLDKKTNLHHYYAQWHATCTCGYDGDDSTAEYAQRDALLHQGSSRASTVRRPAPRKAWKAEEIQIALSCGHVYAEKTEYPTRYQELDRLYCGEYERFVEPSTVEVGA